MTSTSSGPATAPERPGYDGWTPRLVLLLIALIWPTQLLVTVGILGANATSSVAQSFHTTQVVWFSLIVTIASTTLTPFVIKWGDRYGKKRVMIAITALGVLGDLIAVLAGSFTVLLVGRALAACYGPLPALAYPAVRDLFPARLVKPASSILGSSLGLVALASPFLAAWLVDGWGYKGALWFMVSGTAASLVLIVLFVPETPRHSFDQGFDWLGGALLGGGLAVLSYGMSQAQTWGWDAAKTWAWAAAGLAVVAVFLAVESRTTYPIINLGVLRRRPVAAVLVSGALAQAVAFSTPPIAILLALFPRIPHVSDGLGWTAHHNAVVGITWNLVLFFTGLAVSRSFDRRDPRPLWMLGVVILAVGYVLVGLFHGDETDLIWTMSVASFGSGLVAAGAPVLVVNVVSVDEQGLGSGMLNMLMNLASVMLTSVMFGMLNAHRTVLKGTAFYLDGGYRWAFWAAAIVAGISLLAAFFIPKLRPAPAAA